jgi:hypothetical protein
MQVSNIGNTQIPNIDPDQSNPAVRGYDRPVRNAEAQPPLQPEASRPDSGLMATSSPDGADPKLWEMLGPAERAYLSGGFDRMSYGQGSDGSGMGRGVYVDMRV